MQDMPSKEELLDAVAIFLVQSVRPALEDRGLAFRVLIAAHLAGVVARELRSEDSDGEAQLARLRALLVDATHEPGSDIFRELQEELVQRIEDGSIDTEPGSEAWDHVVTTLCEKLAVVNPRFDTSSRRPKEGVPQ